MSYLGHDAMARTSYLGHDVLARTSRVGCPIRDILCPILLLPLRTFVFVGVFYEKALFYCGIAVPHGIGRKNLYSASRL